MSSPQKTLLLTLAERLSAGEAEGLGDFFAHDFTLHDPSAPDWPVGERGARRMIQSYMALGADLRLRALDMVEEGDKVAVRWGVSWTREGAPQQASIVAIYRFADGRITEDWGVVARAPWP